MRKLRVLSIILTVLLLAEIFPPAVFDVRAEVRTYEIRNAEDLEKIQKDLSGIYILQNDISLEGASWQPLGDDEHPFTGSFFGNGHVISDFSVQIDSSNGNALAGFFGSVSGGTILELSLMKARIRAYAMDNTETNYFASAGGIAGNINNGTVIERCNFYGTLEASGNDNNYARTGGIAAGVHSGSSITDCFAVADMTCQTARANAMAGGICAWVSGSTIERCYYEGNINILTDCYTYAGGINASGNKDGQVLNCMSLADAVTLNAAGTDHCVYNPVGCFAGEYTDNAYSEGIFVLAETIGDSSARGISINDLSDPEVYERMGWTFGPGAWLDTYASPKLAGVGRRIVLGADTLSFGNTSGIDYEEYFDVVYPDETNMSKEQLQGQMVDGLCFGMCALIGAVLNGEMNGLANAFHKIASLDADDDSVFDLPVLELIRYLHVMQYDNDYTDLGECATMEGVFETVRSYADGESNEVPILKVRSKVFLGTVGHAILGIDYNEYEDRTEIVCYDPNYPKEEKLLTLYKSGSGAYESWKYTFFPILRELSSKNDDAILKYYEQPSRIYNDLMEERRTRMLSRQEILDRNGD